MEVAEKEEEKKRKEKKRVAQKSFLLSVPLRHDRRLISRLTSSARHFNAQCNPGAVRDTNSSQCGSSAVPVLFGLLLATSAVLVRSQCSSGY